jgi:hypothetical protein
LIAGSRRVAALVAALAAARVGVAAAQIPHVPDRFTVRVEVMTPMSRETRKLTIVDGTAYRLDRVTTDGTVAKSCRKPVGSLQRTDALARASLEASREAWRAHYGLGNAPTNERMYLTIRNTTTHTERTTVIDDPTTSPLPPMPPGLHDLITAVGPYVRGC